MESQNQIFDRRTLLAFALMFAVWFGWAALFGPSTPPPEEQASQEQIAQGGGAEVQPDGSPASEPAPSSGPAASNGESSNDTSQDESPRPRVVSGSPSASGWIDESDQPVGAEVIVRSPPFVGRIVPAWRPIPAPGSR